MSEVVSQKGTTKISKDHGKERAASMESSDEDDDGEADGNGPSSRLKQGACTNSTHVSQPTILRILNHSVSKKTYSKDKIRTNRLDRTLDSMFPVVTPTSMDTSSSSPSSGTPLATGAAAPSAGTGIGHSSSSAGGVKYRNNLGASVGSKQVDEQSQDTSGEGIRPQTQTLTQARTMSRTREIKESECFLTSIVKLRKTVEKSKHNCESPYSCIVLSTYCA
jgi:hypothetical protein